MRPGELGLFANRHDELPLLGIDGEHRLVRPPVGRDVHGERRDLVRQVAALAERGAERVELRVLGRCGDERGFIPRALDDYEIRRHVLDGKRQRLFELKLDHAGQLPAIRGGKRHPLQQHGLAGQREVDLHAGGQGRGRFAERGGFHRSGPGTDEPPAIGVGGEKRVGRAGFLHSFQERI